MKYSLVRSASCLDPRKIAKHDEVDSNVKKFKIVIGILVDIKKLSDESGDSAVHEFRNFTMDFAVKNKNDFVNYKPHSDRIDKFYYQCLHDDHQFQNLWHVIQKLLLLSHGQADVERGFSINKKIEVENLAERSLIAQRMTFDYIKSKGGAHKVAVSKELLSYASGARQRYHLFLEEERKEKDRTVKSLKRKSIMGEIETLKKREKSMRSAMQELDASSEKYALQAEKSSG